MRDMMHSTEALIALMVILILVLGGILVGIRLVGERAFNNDHRQK
ncbi:hypothetical protein [Nocardioides sp.]